MLVTRREELYKLTILNLQGGVTVHNLSIIYKHRFLSFSIIIYLKMQGVMTQSQVITCVVVLPTHAKLLYQTALLV